MSETEKVRMYIAGGAYLEEVEFYEYKNVFGSAVRAAAATAALADEDVSLITCAAADFQNILRSHSDAYDFNLNIQHTTGQPIGFRYYHGLTDGELFGRPDTDQEYRLSVSESSACLRFGMVEGTAVVSGSRVVYDPQSPDPEPFHENGSEAGQLAIVLNDVEAKNWTGKSEAREAGESLLEHPDVEVVVIKQGPKGGLLFDGDQISFVPSYRTSYVWPVGSGDVFSGVFAHYWAERHVDARQAALRASTAAAYFCETRNLPVPEAPQSKPEFTGEQMSRPDERSKPQVYLAGPFFTLGQRWLVNEARQSLLNLGTDVFSPVHEVGIRNEEDGPEQVATSDLDGVLSSDVVLALMDEADRGTSIEIGYARSENIPVVVYADHIGDRHLTMLEGTGCYIFDHFPTAVYQAVWMT
jgi:hypothetical protein